jgi:hypothetical protein
MGAEEKGIGRSHNHGRHARLVQGIHVFSSSNMCFLGQTRKGVDGRDSYVKTRFALWPGQDETKGYDA